MESAKPSACRLLGIFFLVCVFTSYSLFAEDSLAEKKIGIITDLSGPGSTYGVQTIAAAALLRDEYAKQGRAMRYVIEDTGLKTQQAVSAAQKLIFKDEVNAMYVDFTPNVVAVAPILENHKIFLAYAAASRSVVDRYRYAYKSFYDFEQGCKGLAKQFKKSGVVQIGVLRAETEYGDLCAKGVLSVYPKAMIKEYHQGSTVSTQVLLMKASGVEAIINGAYEGDVQNMLSAMRTLNYNVRIGSSKDILTDKMQQRYKNELQGALFFGTADPPEDFLRQIRAVDGGNKLEKVESVGLTYQVLKGLSEAVLSCPAKDLVCYDRVVAATAANEELSFGGYNGRVARLLMIIEEVVSGEFRKVGSYL